MTTGRLPLVIDAGQLRQMNRQESIDPNVVVDGGEGRLALALVRRLVLELTEAGIPLSDTLTEQVANLEGI